MLPTIAYTMLFYYENLGKYCSIAFAILPGVAGGLAQELLVYVAVVTAGISLAKSIIDLIVAIIKARSERIIKGDNPTAPLELIIRRVHAGMGNSKKKQFFELIIGKLSPEQ